jgi:hypothetical protein
MRFKKVNKKGKRRKIMALNTIIDFFSNQIPYKLNDLIQQMFIEDLVLLIAKGYMPLVMVETFGYGVF